MRIPFYIITTIIVAMLGFNIIAGEKLVTENGQVAASSLPLDKETSKTAYETATFGIG